MRIDERYDRLERLRQLVVEMRRLQRAYSLNRTPANLTAAKHAEFAVDKALKELKEPVGLF